MEARGPKGSRRFKSFNADIRRFVPPSINIVEFKGGTECHVSQKKYHYIYKTTCKVTGKFYVGMHSTDNLEDGYLGSGKILGYSRKKYGDENHVREILEMCSSRDELKQREKEMVNEALLADPLNINLKYGGDGGGFSTITQIHEQFLLVTLHGKK